MKKNKRDLQQEVEERFLSALRHHLVGVRKKAIKEFSKESFGGELALLKSDDVYKGLSFDSPE